MPAELDELYGSEGSAGGEGGLTGGGRRSGSDGDSTLGIGGSTGAEGGST